MKKLVFFVIPAVLLCMGACNKHFEDTAYVQLTVKDSLPADKRINNEVLIKVDPDISAAKRSVSFKISPIGEFDNGQSSFTTTIDANGEARAYIRSDKTGVAYVEATVGGYTQRAAVYFGSYFYPGDVLSLQLEKDSIAADNYSYAVITASSGDSNINVRQSVTFTVDKGSFQDGSKSYTTQTNLDGTVKVYVKSAVADLVHVTATVQSAYVQDVFIHFVTAYPEYMTVEVPASLANGPAAKVTVKAQLNRLNGVPSPNQPVFYRAAKPSGAAIGTFVNTTLSNATGGATTDFWVQDTSYSGLVQIKAFVVNQQHDTIWGANQVLITK